ncbi:recombinase family protein [Streptomyces sp. MBT53]|uniref:recombinase family protein n=1 Tax=Streptomyces sp. MBT53 TaxID=1488384 RepID=UPI00191192C2|nr:recombinase family protein [Streptomyces sp. MBT53]MBK6015634.1 recombinase family protein [Streptomyces sp. MBT53]
MASTESENRVGVPPPRRTGGDLARRQNLADAAAGVMPGAGNVPPTAPNAERFRVVIYLCGAPNADLRGAQDEAHEYAESFGWEIAAEIEDRHGLSKPDGRPGLAQAVERVKSREVGAVLTPWRSMISPIPQEFDEVARKIESAGGFLQVMDSNRVRAKTAG